MRFKLFLLLCTITANLYAQDINQLYSAFRSIPDTARTKTWWFHGEGATTRKGITADLEAYKAAGLQGVVYYDQQHGPGTSDALKAMSPEWWQMLKWAGQEAMRLGLSFDINISNGYVLGGPWITPELGMQCVRSSEIVVKGGEHFKAKLPKSGKREVELIAVLAWPINEQDNCAVACLPHGGITVNQPTMLPIASFKESFTARSLSYKMDGYGKGAQSIVNIPGDPQERFFGDNFTWQPPIGELEVSDDSINWRRAATLHSIYRTQSLQPDYTISFPEATGRFFRLNLHDWQTEPKGQMTEYGNWQNAEAQPLHLTSMKLSSTARIDRWEERAAYYTEYIRPSETPDFKDGGVVDADRLLNLTSYINAQGELDWTAPRGASWKIVRFVSCTTGGKSKHGRQNLLGPECDKLSPRGAIVCWKNYTKSVLDTLRQTGVKVGSVCMDSHEAGDQNWTQDFDSLFLAERGYDIKPYLPAMQGYIVGNVERTERFLQDLRRTIADAVSRRYFATIDSLCHDEGVELTAQAMGNGQSICSDNLMAKGYVDRPQGEFWTRMHHGSYDTREAASAAHLYGKHIASAEAFTDYDYAKTLAQVKDEIDMETAMQINEFVICASEAQPYIGPDSIFTAYNRDYAFNRKNPLWRNIRNFFDYQARNHFMMRQGRSVADILVYAGDEAPMKMLSHRLPIIPEGSDFDVCTTDALLHAVQLQGHRLIARSGSEYCVLAIEKSAVVRPETERLIAEWKAQGLPVYDNRVEGDSALSETMRRAGILPDVAIHSRRSATDRVFLCHRQTGEADIYFLVNHSLTHEFDDQITLRTSYRHAEWWNSLDGSHQQISAEPTDDGRLRLRLRLRPGEAGFIVVGSQQHGPLPVYNPWAEESVEPVCSPWTLSFDTLLGGPTKPIVTTELQDLCLSTDTAVRYFAGTVTYTTNVKLKKKPIGNTLLRIPNLQGAAHVIVNGIDAGYIWCSPWDINISHLLHKGNNHLQIEVSIRLINRLIGDAALPQAKRKLWVYTQLYKATDKLLPAGIIGDVQMVHLNGNIQQ